MSDALLSDKFVQTRDRALRGFGAASFTHHQPCLEVGIPAFYPTQVDRDPWEVVRRYFLYSGESPHVLGALECLDFPLALSVSQSAAVEDARPVWWDAVERRFGQIRSLRENWDAYGAGPIASTVADRSLALLASIVEPASPQPSVIPTAKGGIQLEWHTLVGDLEVELGPDSSIAVLFTDALTGTDHEPPEPTEADLRALVKALSPVR